ncbi:glycoside hydrolase family 31 protein [Sinomonas sp. JGH33]|uniref:Glycoside hydrolase family 31 protein n=1 Tax=Sinomonas terricola TaxID=3110330 RepID=A0ABU5TAK6_9MICC|nr:TIM-barrel domain-containing protein [Sinomonas sp. JGH33]MEA5456708.1 glycoside hydrolase family 31 protein [Sinomonas sp. JGH33]
MTASAPPTITRRTAILGVLGAVPLSLLPAILRAEPAHADTLSGVFHGPTGYDELYSTTPTERSPRDPMATQTVQLHSTTWPISPGQTCWVSWSKNGVAQTDVGCSFDYNSGNNSYWKINLGTFAKGDQITYTVHADVDGGGALTSGPFSFSVTDWSGTGNVSGYTDNGTSVDVAVSDTSGSFSPKVRFTFPAPDRFHVQIAPHGTGLNITGTSGYTVTDSGGTLVVATSALQLKIQKSPYRVSVYKADGTTLIAQQYDPSVFRNTGWASDGATTVTKIEDHWRTPAGERFESFGERYDYLDQRGRDVDNYVYNQYQDQGPTHRTYMSVPFFTNSAGYGVYIPSTRYSLFNVCTYLSDMVGFTVNTSGALDSTVDYHFLTGTQANILDAYTSITGRPWLPPKWAFGLWMSANEWNTQTEVMNELGNVTSYNIPHSVLVLEQWSDEATFYIWHGSTYTAKPGSDALVYSDFTFPSGGEWSDPKSMVTSAHNQNIKVVLWQIPVLKQDFDTNPSTAPQQHLNDQSYATSQGYLVGDGAGGQYRIPTGEWFGDSTMPDFTNAAATSWWMSKRAYLFDDVGIDGMKTDGGEMIFGRNVTFADGRKGDEMHNGYTNAYTGAYGSYVQTKKNGNGVLFSRGGTAGGQAHSIYWAGDQASTFSAFQQALRAGLSGGESGIPFWAWDMAGFTGTFPSSELYLRAAAQQTYSPMMQYHSEKSDPSPSEARTPWNVQARTGDTTVIPTFRKFANTRMNLIPYIYTEAKNASLTGLPLLQTMRLAFPGDSSAAALDMQYMFGRQLLVAPITTQGATSVTLYLPAGEWHDVTNGGKASGPGNKTYNADTSTIPVYARDGAIIPLNLNANYEYGGNINNDVYNYTNLVFRMYPAGSSSCDFFDDAAGMVKQVTSTENWGGHQVTANVPPLGVASTLQVNTTAPSSVTVDGTALTAYSTLSALTSASTGWYWDPVQQFTLVKLASATTTRTVVLSGVDKGGYEAEFATSTGTTTNTNHAGYTGTGFVDGFDASGDSLTFDISANATGTHQLEFRYGNATGGSATRTIYVDGTSIGTLTLPNLANWDTWGTATISTTLTAGRHSVKISYDAGNTAAINLDSLTVARP